VGKVLGREPVFFAYALWSAIVNETTSGNAMALNVVMNSRRVAREDDPDVFTSFCSCSCKIACSASSSVTPGENERCMPCVTLDNVAAAPHASHAAPAVGFRAKTFSFPASTMSIEPSGSLFTVKASVFIRSTCM